jgi:hypothetical protein
MGAIHGKKEKDESHERAISATAVYLRPSAYSIYRPDSYEQGA